MCQGAAIFCCGSRRAADDGADFLSLLRLRQFDDVTDKVTDRFCLTVVVGRRTLLTIFGQSVTEHTVLEWPDHVDGHPVLKTFFADDDLFLQEFVRNQVFGPSDNAGNRAADAGAGDDRTLRGSKVQTHVKDVVLRPGRRSRFSGHIQLVLGKFGMILK